MNFKEYLEQKNPIQNNYVEIFENDCKAISDVLGCNNSRKVITLEIHKKRYQYHLSMQDNLLRTMDEHGNPKSISVFVWKGQ